MSKGRHKSPMVRRIIHARCPRCRCKRWDVYVDNGGMVPLFEYTCERCGFTKAERAECL